MSDFFGIEQISLQQIQMRTSFRSQKKRREEKGKRVTTFDVIVC